MLQLTDAVVQGLKDKNGEVYLLSAAGEHVVATVPSSAQFQQFKDYAADDRKRTRALETLTRACVVYPDALAMDVLLERRPGLATSFGSKLVELAGAVEDVEAKKL
jgi:regulator of sirC expression with transglutaminase-like and TPR domain